MLTQHKIDLGALGVCTCDVESAVTVVRKPTIDNYDNAEIKRVTVALGPVRADVTALLSEESVEEIQEEILESLNERRPTQLPLVAI